ncbi:hypothetical protein A0J61_05103 [Choanephora cucurbitarum]|uniref:Uncharacterized protein n=1 Tax=Choanephora cucurbitarum TaxID=101091 RepID=A0A1C7ND15_9FUNG|nr:hypothetical protein A0J61_05103 [Choanephora cucurbitarum]
MHWISSCWKSPSCSNKQKTEQQPTSSAADVLLLENLDGWKKKQKKFETELVSRVCAVLDIFLQSTTLYIKIGETAAEYTKEACTLNELNYSGGNISSYSINGSSLADLSSGSKMSGRRKIDLMIKNEDNQKLAYVEFKASKSKCLCQYRQSKNLRLNQRIKIEQSKLFVDERLISFNWEGSFGKFFVMEEKNGIMFSRPANGFFIPDIIEVLDEEIIDTILALVAWRDYLVEVFLEMKKAVRKSKRRNTSSYPDTCFTTVNTKKRK